MKVQNNSLKILEKPKQAYKVNIHEAKTSTAASLSVQTLDPFHNRV